MSASHKATISTGRQARLFCLRKFEQQAVLVMSSWFRSIEATRWSVRIRSRQHTVANWPYERELQLTASGRVGGLASVPSLGTCLQFCLSPNE
jgi:hypothetical protein